MSSSIHSPLFPSSTQVLLFSQISSIWPNSIYYSHCVIQFTMYECDVCNDEYFYQGDLEERLDYYDHWIECGTCTRKFRSRRACKQHMNALDHWATRYECDVCPQQFFSLARAYASRYCKSCKRLFQNESNLRMVFSLFFKRGSPLI